ncbi:MAG: PA4642 family protein [Pseudohongiellaceae bacterium]|nr:PA4642 family protein [Pseudohongiellaceae bacterium]
MIEEKKTGAARTQPATRNETWSDERVKSFLDFEAPEGMPRDYYLLEKAYRGMLPDLFERFIAFFIADKHDINAKLEDGSTFLDQVSAHRKSGEYASILTAAGAVKGK